MSALAREQLVTLSASRDDAQALRDAYHALAHPARAQCPPLASLGRLLRLAGAIDRHFLRLAISPTTPS